MDSSGSLGNAVKKQEDDGRDDKRDVKPIPKTLNRVPRACNACRKQKMRCEGADNPPCKRCRNGGFECLFEKPSREATLTGEAGLERIRSLEAHVAEIRHVQTSISATLQELLLLVRTNGLPARSPSAYPFQQSPHLNSPSASTPTASNPHASPQSSSSSFTVAHAPPQGQARLQGTPFRPGSSEDGHPPQLAPLHSSPGPGFPPGAAPYNPVHHPSQNQVLPSFAAISSMSTQVAGQAPIGPADSSYQRSGGKPPVASNKRQAPLSNVTSADSSDVEEDENGELPDHGLLAPWEVLRGLADVAVQQAAKENGDGSEPHSRTRTPSPDRPSRPAKKRKTKHKPQPPPVHLDVVSRGLITEAEARALFKIFYHGCSTFLPVFDASVDTFDSLRERCPFAVDCICAVAARVRDGGRKPSEEHIQCLKAAQLYASQTLFSQVAQLEAVQAMIILSGWSDNGWLSGGHAVRMAMELSMHKAWPRLLRRMNANKVDLMEDKHLVSCSRTWFCLYLFEHQLSYGTGRPAVLKDDESIKECRYLVNHPLAIEDDMRLVSTVELISIRERVHNALSPFDGPVLEEHFEELQRADADFQAWFRSWDQSFSKKYEDAAFYRQSLQIQYLHAELFHNAAALRGVNGPEDVERMPSTQHDLAIRSITIARRGLEITLDSPAYREGMRYAVHYTHATATFAASFLLRLGRLFPGACDISELRSQVERLSQLMLEVPGKRYALTLQLMLKRSAKKYGSQGRSPKVPRRNTMSVDRPPNGQPTPTVPTQRPSEPFSPVYEHNVNFVNVPHVAHHPHPLHHGPIGPHAPGPHPPGHHYVQHHPPSDADQIWKTFEHSADAPFWLTDQSLGGSSFSQGMDAFIIPQDYAVSQMQWS